MHLEQVCSGASSWGAGAWYHKDINISFNCKLLSLSMTSSGICPEFPLSLKSKTGIVFRITIPVCSDELKEDWKENRCKQIILDVRGIRVTQRKLLWEFWVPLRGEKYICNKQRKKKYYWSFERCKQKHPDPWYASVLVCNQSVWGSLQLSFRLPCWDCKQFGNKLFRERKERVWHPKV